MKKWAGLLVATLLTGALTTALPTAEAGSPGTWTNFAGNDVKASRGIATLRTSDGVLHVAFVRDEPGGADTLMHAKFSAAGQLLGTNPVVSNWDGINGNVQLLPTPDGGIRALFGGFTGVTPPQSTAGVYSSFSDATGNAWTAPLFSIGSSQAFNANGMGGALQGDGSAVVAYPLNSGMYIADDSTTSNFDDGFCCLDNPSLVAKDGFVFVGYTANGGTADTTGTFVRMVRPTVAAPSTTVKAPRSSVGGAASGNQQAVPFVNRDGEMWLAYCVGYPSCNYIGLWQMDTSRVFKIPGSRDARHIAMSVDPSSRIWVAWTNTDGKIKALRTSPAGMKFGAVRTLKKPSGAGILATIGLNTQRGRVDLLQTVGSRLHHQQVLPGLTIKASPSRWAKNRAQRVTFTVTDATLPVKRAKVRAGSKSCTTSASGRCTIAFGASGAKRFTGTATKSGYATGTVGLRVS